MEDLETPDTLEVLDRRVYDLAIQPIPLAEIAIRLGVSVSQADERIQRVCSRLGVADRAALREWAPETAAEPEDPPSDTALAEAPLRRHSRRVFIAAAGGAGIAALGGGALVWKLWAGGSDEKAAPAAGQTPEATTPAATTETTFITEVPFDENWEVKTFPKGDMIDWPHGLFLMGVAGGEIRAHRLKTSQAYDYRTWPGGRFVAAAATVADAFQTMQLMDLLNTDVSWTWSYEKLQLIAVGGTLPDATLVFERREDYKGTGDLILLRSPRPGAGLEPFAAVTVPTTGFNTPVLLSPDLSSIAVVSAGGPRLVVTVVDAATGEVRATLDPGLSATSADVGFALDALQNLDGGDSFLLAWHLFQQGRGEWMRGFAMNFRWDGGGRSQPTFHDHAASFSTDGKLYLREVPLRTVSSEGADGPREYWPAVEIVETSSGNVQSRVRSAAIYYGDWAPSRRWLGADAFAALVRTTKSEDGYDFGTISTRTASGNWNARMRYAFEPDPALDDMWFQSPWVQGVVPSPENPEVVALGKWATLNTRDGQLVKASVRTDSGPAHIDPWAAGPNWLTFAFPHLGHGGASPPVLLQPKFESPDTPIESPLRFKVSAPGDRLNLRDQPSLSGRIIASLDDGSVLTQAESADPARPQGRRGLEQGKDGTWVYVTTSGGIEGWVNSAYLAWA